MAAKILAYLSRNPDADDTLEGVAQWWLLDQAIVEETTTVKQALAELAAEGIVVESTGADGRLHYGLNPRKRDQTAGSPVLGNSNTKEVFMPVRIRNRSGHLVTVELNTRETIHLAPNEISRALDDFETAGNRQLDKLIEGRYVEQIESQAAAASADEGAKKKAGRAR